MDMNTETRKHHLDVCTDMKLTIHYKKRLYSFFSLPDEDKLYVLFTYIYENYVTKRERLFYNMLVYFSDSIQLTVIKIWISEQMKKKKQKVSTATIEALTNIKMDNLNFFQDKLKYIFLWLELDTASVITHEQLILKKVNMYTTIITTSQHASIVLREIHMRYDTWIHHHNVIIYILPIINTCFDIMKNNLDVDYIDYILFFSDWFISQTCFQDSDTLRYESIHAYLDIILEYTKDHKYIGKILDTLLRIPDLDEKEKNKYKHIVIQREEPRTFHGPLLNSQSAHSDYAVHSAHMTMLSLNTFIQESHFIYSWDLCVDDIMSWCTGDKSEADLRMLSHNMENLICRIYHDPVIFSIHDLKFKLQDAFQWCIVTIQHIHDVDVKLNIVDIFIDECLNSLDTCSTGILVRLANTFTGYSDVLHINNIGIQANKDIQDEHDLSIVLHKWINYEIQSNGEYKTICEDIVMGHDISFNDSFLKHVSTLANVNVHKIENILHKWCVK